MATTENQSNGDDSTVNRERLEKFGRIFGIIGSDMESGGALKTAGEITDEDLAEIRDVEGGTIDPANVVALIFDREEWGKIPNNLMDDMENEAISCEQYETHDHIFEVKTSDGTRSILTKDYVKGIGRLIGVDLQENPEHILMTQNDNYPIHVEDTQSDAEILLAPRV